MISYAREHKPKVYINMPDYPRNPLKSFSKSADLSWFPIDVGEFLQKQSAEKCVTIKWFDFDTEKLQQFT